MNDALENSKQYLTGILENLVAIERMAATKGVAQEGYGALHGLIPEIERIIEESYPLARLLDSSDLLVHAEGPGASRELPLLGAYSWVFQTIERSVRHYFTALFSGVAGASPKISNEIDLRVSGIAHGSIWVGVKVKQNPMIMGEMLASNEHFPTLDMLPRIAEQIGDEVIMPGMRDLNLDPLFLDAALTILKGMAPTGGKGIHTLEISTKEAGSARLSQRERVVISAALKGLLTDRQKRGSLEGAIRAADLDKSRLFLRSKDILVRCLFPDFSDAMARTYLGKSVCVTGLYEMDRFDRPRRMVVENIQVLPSSASLFDCDV